MQEDLTAYQWQRIAELPGDATSYDDTDRLQNKCTYFYAVIPVANEDDALHFGSPSTKGIAAEVGGAK